MLRTHLAAIVRAVPVSGRMCPVSSEYFAISGDVHLVLGELAPEDYTCPTPDGRPATVPAARRRLARLVCADAEQLGDIQIDAIAAFVREQQIAQIGRGLLQVLSRLGRRPDLPIIAVGMGASLAEEAARRLGFVPSGGAARSGPRGRRGRAELGRGTPPRRTTGGTPMNGFDAVLKVGGSLSRGPDLEHLGQALGQLGRHYRLLLVPGGGQFADVVRYQYRRYRLSETAAHRMALLAMDQYGCLLAELIPGSSAVQDLWSARRIADDGRLPILLPAAWCCRPTRCLIPGMSPPIAWPRGSPGSRAQRASCS